MNNNDRYWAEQQIIILNAWLNDKDVYTNDERVEPYSELDGGKHYEVKERKIHCWVMVNDKNEPIEMTFYPEQASQMREDLKWDVIKQNKPYCDYEIKVLTEQ
jgi:hypothetical protein